MTQFQSRFRLERVHLQELFDTLTHRGYQIVGPTVRDRAIVYDQLNSVADLPMGWTDERDGGRYRLKRRDDDAMFGFTVGPHSWKQFLHPPKQRLWRAERLGKGFEIISEDDKPPKYAFIGVRSCDLSAIAFRTGSYCMTDMPIPFTGRGAKTASSWRSTAGRRAARASVSR